MNGGYLTGSNAALFTDLYELTMAQAYLADAMSRVETSARKVVAAIAEGDMLRTQMAILRRLLKHDPYNTIALKQQIAARVMEAGRYTF